MELIKSISFKTIIPFIIAFIAIVAFHFSVDLTTGDYKYFRIYAFGFYEQQDVFSFLQWRYATWTSRLFVEFFTFWFVQYSTLVFTIIDSVIMLAIIFMTYLLFSKKRGTIYVITAILLSFTYKITDMGISGYLVTIIGYIWPLATFLLTLFPFKKSIESGNNTQPYYLYFLHGLCAMFCCSCEQLCIGGIMVWGMFVAYTYLQSKRIDYLYCFLLLIALANLAMIGICPGNTIRTLTEMHHVPNYENFSFFKKIALCIATPVTKYMIVSEQSLIIWVFSILLPLSIYLKKKKPSIALFVSIIPVIMLSTTLIKQHIVTLQVISKSDLVILCIVSTIFYGAMLFSLLYLGKEQESLIAKYGPSFIFLVGFASRAAIGFTLSFPEPTRTFFLLEYSMVVISILFLSKTISEWKEQHS